MDSPWPLLLRLACKLRGRKMQGAMCKVRVFGVSTSTLWNYNHHHHDTRLCSIAEMFLPLLSASASCVRNVLAAAPMRLISSCRVSSSVEITSIEEGKDARAVVEEEDGE
jgi:hypothetical protein